MGTTAASTAKTDPAAEPIEVRVPVDEFRLAVGGPFFELQERLGLLHERALRVWPRLLVYVAIAFLVPLLLAVGEGVAQGGSRPFLLDPVVWARFVVAIGIFVLMDRLVDDRLRHLLTQFVQAPLIAPGSMPGAAQAVNRALQRKDATLPEVVCILLALSFSLSTLLLREFGPGSWIVTGDSESSRLTLVAWWCLLVSEPLFWFLLLRWLWRHLVWAMLLRDLARLELRLVATHLDRTGGLGFVGRYPNVFAAFVFAVGCVLAAGLVRELLAEGMQLAAYGSVMGVWLIVVFALFLIPLRAFQLPLRELKESTMLACSAQATRRERAKERDVLQRNVAVAADPGSAADGEVADPGPIYEAACKLRTLPFSRAALLPLGAAALLPLIAAGATQLPVKELVSVAKKLLLL
jgi:hypothetical protein